MSSLDIDKENHSYLINEENQTAILIPKNIVGTLSKMSNPSNHKSLIAADIFTVALTNRRLKNVIGNSKHFENPSSTKHHYSQDQNTLAFSKLLKEVLLSPLFERYFTEKEIQDLIRFILQCPHGYSFSPRILPHMEFSPVLV